jgi:hypothetical protein
MTSKIFPPTSKRIQMSSDATVNNDIRNCTIKSIDTHKNASAELQNKRINDLDNEWDIERILSANAGALVLMTSLLGLRRSKMFLLTGIIGYFMLQHAVQGWCPPLEIIRKFGVRTAEEIFQEKTAIKLARGDFDQKPENEADMLKAIEK